MLFLQRKLMNPNVLALYSFYPPEPKCITQSKMQRSQINFAKELNLAPEPQKWTTLLYKIINIVRNDLKNRISITLTITSKVCVAHRYLASNAFQQVIADSFNISKSTVSRCVHRFVEAIIKHTPEFIRFPNKLVKIKNGFYSKANFPGVIGAIDCTHLNSRTFRKFSRLYQSTKLLN